MPIVIKSAAEIEIMQEAGRITAETLQLLVRELAPGMTSADLDRLARAEFKRRNVTPAFLGYPPNAPRRQKKPGDIWQFPGAVCVSINSKIVHGIPHGREVIREGDIVSIDIGAVYRGYVGDCALTVAVGEVPEPVQQLLDVTQESLRRAIMVAQPGSRLGDIGWAVQDIAQQHRYGIVKGYGGHGVGREMHEEPHVVNHGDPGTGTQLRAGMVIAIEPMLNLGHEDVKTDPDGWSVWTRDGSLSAHYEHTIAITKTGPRILTLPGDVSQDDYLSGRVRLDRTRVATPA